MRVRRSDEVQGVVEGEEQGDDDGLRHFDAVDSREYINAVGTEDGHASHVNVVERT